MPVEAQREEGAFARGERRLSVSAYIGLVASCQSALNVGMARLSPASQVAIWSSLQPDALLPSSGRRTLWALRRGVLDDLAPLAQSMLPAERQWVPTKDEQLAFRAVLEALATGRQTQGEICGFCNLIHDWPTVLGVSEYLKGELAAAVRLATLEIVDNDQPRQVRLPSWGLVGALLDPVRAAGRRSEVAIGAFTAALASLLGPASAVLTEVHAHLLVRLYGATRAGRKASAPEIALRTLPLVTKKGVSLSPQLADRLPQVVQDLETLGLVQRTETQQIRWIPLTLVHLPPGQGAAPPT
ncbi:hypothetical protein [Variovorax ginsengisoli]|uniref:MarR family transcriptional regulator n=1 Tax=Variovorax ginsengisoli TaxID=363844 RepID=A0ABT8S5I9_9BURK|nr:hypothetical protein [Variovorax ginsengisoli]MDN8615008.1 hypothetical protein [Variovorax ginsengisoli]MDO1534178.1 hypothetical protein [Variovorax ginsengisoli]